MTLDPDRFKEQLNVGRLFFSKMRGPASSFGVSLTFTWRHRDYHCCDVWNLPEWEPLGHCSYKAGVVATFSFNLRGPGCHCLNNELVMENIVVQLPQRLASLANEIALGFFLATFSGAHTRKCDNVLTFTDNCGNHGGVLTRVG